MPGSSPLRFDYLELAREARRLDRSRCTQTLRLAVLGDCATQHLAAILPVLFSRGSIDVSLFEAEYDSIELQSFDPASELYAFSPDAIVLLNSTGKLRKKYYAFGENKADFPDCVVQKMVAIWDAVARHSSATVIQSTFVLPVERFYGNFDNKVQSSLYACAQRVNVELTREARSRSAVLINDLDYLASYVGKQTWIDETLWTVAKGLCALEHLPRVGGIL